jgi:hypothetical protein
MITTGLLELVWIPFGIIVGWLYTKIGKLESRVDNKVDKDDYHEILGLVSEIRDMLTEVRLEVAKWVGKLEGQAKPRD